MSRRAEQIAALLRSALQDVLSRGFQDPRIRGLITITNVTLSPDLRSASIFVSIYPAERQELTMHGLTAAARHIRHEISDKIDLRYTPDLHFKLDTSLKKQAGVFEALAKIAQERELKGELSQDADPEQDSTDPHDDDEVTPEDMTGGTPR